MLENIIRRLYHIMGKDSNKDKTYKTNKNWVECISCGYKGTLEEFLQEDADDTQCPKCGEDVQRFEL